MRPHRLAAWPELGDDLSGEIENIESAADGSALWVQRDGVVFEIVVSSRRVIDRSSDFDRDEPVQAIAASGATGLAVAYLDRIVAWQQQPFASPPRVVPHAEQVRRMVAHPDGRLVAIREWNGIVEIWDLVDGACVGRLDAKRGHDFRDLQGEAGFIPAGGLSTGARGNRIVTFGSGGEVAIWDWQGAKVGEASCSLTAGATSACLGDGRLYVVDDVIVVWPSSKPRKVTSRSIALAANAKLDIVTVDRGDDDVEPLEWEHGDEPTHAALVADVLAAGKRDGSIDLWDLASGRCIATAGARSEGDEVTAIAAIGDSDGFAVGDSAGGVTLWKLSS
jgi:WD40 repeat protein